MSAEPVILRCGGRALELGRRTYVMGIVNITPDSFSDGGRYLDPQAALVHARELLAAGADVVDLGAESTRPGHEPVGEAEELRRLLPVLDTIVAAGIDCISVDTSKPAVAAAALERGAAWINDVSSLADAGLAAAAVGAQALVVMHRGPVDAEADDPLAALRAELARLCRRAEAAGVAPERLVVDPGIGFGKDVDGNVAVLRHLGSLAELGRPVLVGPSRKRFLGVLGGTGPADALARGDATVGACCVAAMAGADLVRVHDVRAARRALAVVDAVRRAPGRVR